MKQGTNSLSSFCENSNTVLLSTKMAFQHRSHEHMLTSCELEGEIEPVYCKECDRVICGPAYVCETCSDFKVHKSCTELQSQILHPLHRHHLILDDMFQSWGFICDGCRDYSEGSTFRCRWCEFNLDVKCASIMDKSRVLGVERTTKTTIYPFYHDHKLSLCNFREPYKSSCSSCRQIILGSAYACVGCRLFLHESCAEIPDEVDHLFHRQHPLRLCELRPSDSLRCYACKDGIDTFSFCCEECNLDFHRSCLSPFPSLLKLKLHDHDLFCFVRNFVSKELLLCNNCYLECEVGNSFYRCFECDINFHPECIPLPRVLKHECHELHPLTFMNLFEEGDYEEYYCDICEKKGDPNHPVYCCEECTFIAHIECVISEDDSSLEILSYLEPRSKVEAEKQNDIEKKNDEAHQDDAEEEKNREEVQERDTEEESDANEESPVPPEIYAKLANLPAEMEALAVKLESVKEKQASELGSIILSYREKIMESKLVSTSCERSAGESDFSVD